MARIKGRATASAISSRSHLPRQIAPIPASEVPTRVRWSDSDSTGESASSKRANGVQTDPLNEIWVQGVSLQTADPLIVKRRPKLTLDRRPILTPFV
jgi:hypothetical protein